MTPNGQLSELAVWKMIRQEIATYDVGNTKRHEENTKKMDRLLWWLMSTFAAVAGVLVLTVIRLALGR
jgi:hypothetical protein